MKAVLLHGDSTTADVEPCGPEPSPCSSAVKAALLRTYCGDLAGLDGRGSQCAPTIPPVRIAQYDEGGTLLGTLQLSGGSDSQWAHLRWV